MGARVLINGTWYYLVGFEACPSAHHWGRELQALGHTVKLIPPSYVKAYLKRGTTAIEPEAGHSKEPRLANH